MKNTASLFFVSFVVLTGCSSIPKMVKNPPPRVVHADSYEYGQPPKQRSSEDEGRDFNKSVVRQNRARLAHEERSAEAEYAHNERFQQIKHAGEEANAAADAGIQIAPPTAQGTHGSVSDPSVEPWSGQQAMGSARQSGQPTWVDGAGVTRLRPNRFVGSGGTEARGSQPLWVDGVGVTRLAPARQVSEQPVSVNAIGRTALAPSRVSGARGFFQEWNQRFWDFGPQKPVVSGFSRTAVAGARGRVTIRETGFERQVKAFNGGSTFPSLATGVPEGTYLKPVLSGSAVVVGAGQYRSGLDRVFGGR